MLASIYDLMFALFLLREVESMHIFRQERRRGVKRRINKEKKFLANLKKIRDIRRCVYDVCVYATVPKIGLRL